MTLHPTLSKNNIFKSFLSLQIDDFRVLQKVQKNKEQNEINNNGNLNSIVEINKFYEYAQAYVKNTLHSTLMKNNKSYDTTEVDVLMEKTRRFEEAFLSLSLNLENLTKIQKSFSEGFKNEPDFRNEQKQEINFDSLGQWQNVLYDEKKFHKVLKI